MNNNNSQLLPGSQNDDQTDPQTVSSSMTPGHPIPSIAAYSPMPVQFRTSDSDGSLGDFMTYGMRFNFNRTAPQVGGGQRAQTNQANGPPVSSPFKPLSQLYFRQMDLAMNLIAHSANQIPSNAGPTPYPQTHGFVTQGGNTQPSTNTAPSSGNSQLNFSVGGDERAGTNISTGSSSDSRPRVPSVYNSKKIFREDKTSILVREYLNAVPLKERANVFRNILKLYKDDFVNRLLIYDSNPTSLEEGSHAGPHIELNKKGKCGSYAECKACYAEIKLSDEQSFDPKEWEHHSTECLARQENMPSGNQPEF